MSNPGELHIALPTMSIDAVRNTLRALFAQKKPAGAAALCGLVGLSQSNTSTCLRISLGLGLVEETKARGLYLLTQSGKELVRFLESGRDDEAKRIVRDAILERPEWEETLSFLRVNAGRQRSYSDLALYLESRSDRQLKKEVRRIVASSLKSILVYSGVTEDDKNELVPNEDVLKQPEYEDNLSTPPPFPIVDQGQRTRFIESKGLGTAVFSVPSKFTVTVTNNIDAIGELRQQVTDKSSLAAWLDLLSKNLAME